MYCPRIEFSFLYERGANELPIHHLITLSKYYGVTTDYLLGLSKER